MVLKTPWSSLAFLLLLLITMRVSFFLFAFFFFLTLLPGNTGSLRYLHSVHPSPSFYVSGRRAFYFYPIYLRTPLDIIVRVLQSLFFRFPHVFRTFVAFRSFLPLGPPVGPPLCPRSMVSAPLCAVLVASCSVSFLFFFFLKNSFKNEGEIYFDCEMEFLLGRYF